MAEVLPTSIPGVVDVIHTRGARATATLPDLLIEVPHGATRTEHFTSLRAQLKGPFPADLIDFFYVNTDVGAPECAEAMARQIVAAAPERAVTILRCQIPRTFIDCNRIIDEATRPTASTATGMTPGVVRYVTDADDLALLFARYSAYREAVTAAHAAVLNAGGTSWMLHTYAPRSVDVPVDENIVQSLHAAYAPDVVGTWPLRADLDLISKTPDGTLLADAGLVRRVRDIFVRDGRIVTECGTYPLHPSSLAHTFATRWPGQTLCLELRRDLLVSAFTPFAEMRGDDVRCARLGGLLAEAQLAHWSGA